MRPPLRCWRPAARHGGHEQCEHRDAVYRDTVARVVDVGRAECLARRQQLCLGRSQLGPADDQCAPAVVGPAHGRRCLAGHGVAMTSVVGLA